MKNQPSPLIIDARPRGPRGPLACELVLGKPVLALVLEATGPLAPGAIVVHGRHDEMTLLRSMLPDTSRDRVSFRTGPPPEGHIALRTDRLYDPARLRRAFARGRDPENAVLWRLDAPAGLDGAGAELVRRQTYQPLGRFWAYRPARRLAEALRDTPVTPNAVTLASSACLLGAALLVAFASPSLAIRLACACLIALALVLDTADGHLARLQGSATEFGRWLDGLLDECGDMALHAAVAWSSYAATGQVGWLLAGMAYGMGKFLFFAATQSASGPGESTERVPARAAGRLRGVLVAIGHADLRFHLWIVLAGAGLLRYELVAFALYYPLRLAAGAVRKGATRAA